MTKEQAKEILLLLFASFPHADSNVDPALAAARLEIFERDIGQLHYAPMMEAVESIRFSCKFFPSMAEIREHYNASNRPKPEREIASSLFPAIPPIGSTVASPEQVREACHKVYELLGVNPLGDQPAPDDEATHAIEERAAIMEFNGGLPRDEAERRARAEAER